MASEPSEEPLSVTLPADLAAWVDDQADAREVDRETLLVQLLTAHREAVDLDPEEALSVTDIPGIAEPDVEDAVRSVVAERIDSIADAVADELGVEQRVADAVEGAQEDLAAAATEAAVDRTTGEVEELRAEFWEKIEDVRERVIQVKQEADAKAPADHEHVALDERLETLSSEIEGMESAIEDVRVDLVDDIAEEADRVDELDDTVQDLEDRLQTVAYVLKELRESNELDQKRARSVEQIKRRAAELDLDRAACEICGSGVELALMTEPECPHCEATVNDVEPADGFFGKPHLVKAQGIEAGGEPES